MIELNMSRIASLTEPAFGWVLRDCNLMPTKQYQVIVHTSSSIAVKHLSFLNSNWSIQPKKINFRINSPASFNAFTKGPFKNVAEGRFY